MRAFSTKPFSRNGVATKTSTLSISFICVALVRRQDLEWLLIGRVGV